jgi:hypothetical protein
VARPCLKRVVTQALPMSKKGDECDRLVISVSPHRYPGAVFAWIATAASLWHPPAGQDRIRKRGFFCFITQCIPLEDDGFGRLDNLGSEEEFIAEFEGVRKDYVSVQFTDIRQEKRRKSLG